MNSATDLLGEKLRTFFEDIDHANIAIAVLTDRVAFPKRTIDWYITTYTRRHAVFIQRPSGRVLDLHSSYKAQLKSFSKKQFDIFKRGTEITFNLNGQACTTTIAQLNFARWFIAFDVYKHFTEQKTSIEREMKSQAKSRSTRTSKQHNPVCGFTDLKTRVVFE